MHQSILLQATEAGARVMQHYFNGQFTISNKEGVNNLVTQADLESEAAIVEVIKEAFPTHSFLTEEAGELPGDREYTWIIDPIDGTINFANGIPICCTSIALEHKGEMVLGAVYNPFMNELFVAEKGKGATLNHKPISVSAHEHLPSACLVTGFPYTYIRSENGPLQVFERLVTEGVAVRRLGSAAIDLCWVACGRFDGFYEHKLNAWDSAAGFLIVEEAGGKVTDFTGAHYSPYQPHLLATNGLIHEELRRVVNGEKLFPAVVG